MIIIQYLVAITGLKLSATIISHPTEEIVNLTFLYAREQTTKLSSLPTGSTRVRILTTPDSNSFNNHQFIKNNLVANHYRSFFPNTNISLKK